jgi:mRNA interferase MazF
MRAIHIAQLDKVRPALILTRETAHPYLRRVTVAPITSTIRGIATEVAVGVTNGLPQTAVVSCDDIATILKTDLGRRIGFLLDEREDALAEAIQAASDLDGYPIA